MTEQEIWLLLYHALLTRDIDPITASDEADEALKEYQYRWGDGESAEGG